MGRFDALGHGEQVVGAAGVALGDIAIVDGLVAEIGQWQKDGEVDAGPTTGRLVRPR